MVDQLGAAAAGGSIDAPVTIQPVQIREALAATPDCLEAGDALAGVLDDFLAVRDRLFGESAESMHTRGTHRQFEFRTIFADRSFGKRLGVRHLFGILLNLERAFLHGLGLSLQQLRKVESVVPTVPCAAPKFR